VATGIQIIEKLRGHTTGYAVPTFVIDGPGGGGKIPIMPNYVVSYKPGEIVLRNYAGKLYTYKEETAGEERSKAPIAEPSYALTE